MKDVSAYQSLVEDFCTVVHADFNEMLPEEAAASRIEPLWSYFHRIK